MTPERAQLSAALAQVVDGLVDLVAAGVAELLRPQLGELVAIRGVAPAPSEPASRAGVSTDLLTIAEAATLLNVAKSTVKWWTYRTKVLPHVSLGPGPRKLCRIRLADLEAFMENAPSTGPRGSAREQAVALLEASQERSEERRRRHVERRDTRVRKGSIASVLTRTCPGCRETRPLSAFAGRGAKVTDRCDRCRRREPEPVALKVIHPGEDPPSRRPWGSRPKLG